MPRQRLGFAHATGTAESLAGRGPRTLSAELFRTRHGPVTRRHGLAR